MQNKKCQQHKLPILFACLDPNCKQTREICAKCARKHNCLAIDPKDLEKQEQEGCVQVREQLSKENEKKSIKKISNDFLTKMPSDSDEDDLLSQIDDSSEEPTGAQNRYSRSIKKIQTNQREGGEDGDESCLITAITQKNVRHSSNGSTGNNIDKTVNLNNNQIKHTAMKITAGKKQGTQNKINNQNLGMINKVFPISAQAVSQSRNLSKMQMIQQNQEEKAEEDYCQSNMAATGERIQEEGTLKLLWNNNKKQVFKREIPKISRSSYKIQKDYGKRVLPGNIDGLTQTTDQGSQNQAKTPVIQGIQPELIQTPIQFSQSKTNRSSNNINKLSQNSSQQKPLFDQEEANNLAILSQKQVQNQQIIGEQLTEKYQFDGKQKEEQNVNYLLNSTQSNQIEQEKQEKSYKEQKEILKKVSTIKSQNVEVTKTIKITKESMDKQMDESWLPKWCGNLKLAKEIINQSAEIKAVRIILANLESIKTTLVSTVEEAKMNFLTSIGMEKQDLGEQDFDGNDSEEEIMNREVEGQGYPRNSQNKESYVESLNNNIHHRNQEQILSLSKGNDNTNVKSVQSDDLNAHENYLIEQYYKREGIKLCNRLNKKVSHNRVSEYLLRVKAVSEFLSTHSIKHIKQSSLCAKLCQLQRELAKILKVKIRTTSKSTAKHDLQDIISQQANIFGYGRNPQMPAMLGQIQQQQQQQLLLNQFLRQQACQDNSLSNEKQDKMEEEVEHEQEEIDPENEGKEDQKDHPQAENPSENSNENDSFDELLSSESPSPKHLQNQENHYAEKQELQHLNKTPTKVAAPTNTPATGATIDFYSILNDSHNEAQKSFSLLDQSFLSLKNFHNLNNFSFSSMLANQSIDSVNPVLIDVPSSGHPSSSRDPHILFPPTPNQAVSSSPSSLNDLLKEPTCQQIYNQYLELTAQQFEEAKQQISDLPQITIEFDGICQKQCSASAFVLKDSQSNEILLEYALDVHVTTANQAEYLGLIFALRTVRQLDVHSIKIASDSDVIVKHLTGIYQLRTAQLKPFFLLAKAILGGFSQIEYQIIHKVENHHAEKLAKSALILENM